MAFRLELVFFALLLSLLLILCILMMVSLVLVWLFGIYRKQGATLLEIKKSFRDVDNVLYDWTDSPSSDYCVWRGVICDNVTYNVVALNLSGLNLEGEISPAIGNLKDLTSVDLKGNRLSGQIPDEIGDCSSLQDLDLSFNEINGDIPFSISKLKQLELLVLKNNQLIGPIPLTLSQIPNLKVLDLAQNRLSGEIPRLLYWNEVLQYLGLRGNNLVGTLSPDMCQLTGLWFLQLYILSGLGLVLQPANRRDSIQHWIFADSYIIIARKSTDGEDSTSDWSDAKALAVLYLHGNQLTGSIPPELGNMTKLHYLDISNNKISGSTFLLPLVTLAEYSKAFNLVENQLTVDLFQTEVWKNLRKVSMGDVRNGGLGKPIISQAIVMSLINCLSLSVLNVSYNNLAGVYSYKQQTFQGFPPDSSLEIRVFMWLLAQLFHCMIPIQAERVSYSTPKLVILHMNMGNSIVYEDFETDLETVGGHQASEYGQPSRILPRPPSGNFFSMIIWKMAVYGIHFHGHMKEEKA
ncbi:hypothetical protein NC652_017520 [Populus alba x Populus x berolinensis]|nr:hypothetical protein NC652_017520 [Populus alba x Populus x berolinensis]